AWSEDVAVMNILPTSLKTLVLTGSLGAAVLLSACQTAPTQHHPINAVTCSKCRTIWVQEPVAGAKPGAGYYTLQNKPVMTCPQCESAVVTFFKTGQLKHHCSICGGTLNHCASH
ncbi:MAG: hypothetical protein WCO97_01460, partial [bacterium]